jgi:(1->4)-alpha-D-glucan 1-alpha-D-glucosylmutase
MKEKCREEGEDAELVCKYRVPGATYRLQLNTEFTFKDAHDITEYLHELGITDCYVSPVFTAKPGSTHGYDICDYAELNPAIGTEEQFDQWSTLLKSLEMGLLLDFVPNHMGVDLSNRWWRDVLQNGENSRFSNWFDINWHPANERLQGKVLLPMLEESYWKMLEAGKLQIAIDDNGFTLSCNGLNFPLSPESLEYLQQEILRLCREQARTTESPENLDALDELGTKLNSRNQVTTATFPQVQRQVSARQAARTGVPVSPKLRHALKQINGTRGIPESFDLLHAILQQQHYQLAHWRLGSEELNYRRFFDVSELVGLRVEVPEAFEAIHALVLRLVQQGKVTGLRIDHPDGLWDPKHYLKELQQAVQDNLGRPENPEDRLFVVAEKILSGDERLPEDWPVAGTTGYDFLNQLNGLFVNRSNRDAMDQLYQEFTGAACDFRALVYNSKLKILRSAMRSEFTTLSRLLQSIAAQTRYGIDLSISELKDCLSSIIAAFPVYRTYMTEQSRSPQRWERAVIDHAIETAALFNRTRPPEIFRFIQALLVLSPPADLDENGRYWCRQFVMKFQQLTGPIMAKGVEDTALFNFNRLISLNEVGGSPDRFGADLNSFHQQNELRAKRWPNTLLATATHDAKRGEDLRARINVLSEIPDEWREAVYKWHKLNGRLKLEVDGEPAPDPNDEYFLYQTLVGTWVDEAGEASGSEVFRERIRSYLLKAIRQAKTHTSWTEPNQAYEQATQGFVEQILTPSKANAFLHDFKLFQRKIALFGLYNSLTQAVLKMTAPGVPDFYQGTELWDYSLGDPDSRDPVDYQARRALFSNLKQRLKESERDISALIQSLLKNYETGEIKLYVIWRVLELRQRHQSLFERGCYVRIAAVGPKQEHICGFAREHLKDCIITITARLLLGLAGGAQRGALEAEVWKDTSFSIPNSSPGDRYKDVLTQQIMTVGPDRSLPIAEVLKCLPAAVLERVC